MYFHHSGGYTCQSYNPVDANGKTYDWVQTCILLATSTTIEIVPCVAPTDGVASQLFSEVVPYTTSITTESVTSTYTYSAISVHAPLYVTPESKFRPPIAHQELAEFKSTGGQRIWPLRLQHQLLVAVPRREGTYLVAPSPGSLLVLFWGLLVRQLESFGA